MRIRHLLMAGLTVFAFTSCQKLFLHERAGESIMFDASVDHGYETAEGPSEDIETKTEYSGYVRNNKERIDWVNGDQVRIFLHTHGNNNSNSAVSYKDYYTVNITPDGVKSKAKVAAVTSPLQWVNGRTHDFYSLYPADAISQSNTTFNGSGAKFTITLPDEQYGDMATNMRYAYMAAASKGYSSNTGKGTVELDYYPMVTTFFITITNNCSSRLPIDLRKIGLKHMHKFNNGESEANKRPYYLSGTYDLATNGGNTFSYNASNFRNGSTYVGAEFEPNSLAYGESVSCVLFTLPQNFNASDLKLTVRTTKSCVANTLANSRVNTFQAGKKYNLNITLNEKDILVSDVEITANSTQLVAKMLLEKLINFETIQSVLDDVTGVYPGSGTCEIVDGRIRVLVDNDDGTRTWRWLTDDEIRYLAATVKTIDLHESYFTQQTVLTVEDFSIFCNLEKISFLELNNVTELDLSGMEKLTDIQFHHGGQIRIEDCPNLRNVTLADLQGATLVRFKNCPAMTSYTLTGNGSEQAQHTNFEFIDMPGLQHIEFERVGSVTVQNCPELLTLKVNTPSNTTQFISITDAPKFRTGTIGRQRDYPCENRLPVTLTNVSNNASGNPRFDIYYRNNHPTITKNNSNRISVVSHHWDYGRNRDVTDTNLQ